MINELTHAVAGSPSSSGERESQTRKAGERKKINMWPLEKIKAAWKCIERSAECSFQGMVKHYS